MDIEDLRSELERLFDLDELIQWSRTILGIDPERLGGTLAKASFARALAAHCLENDAIEALCDALAASKPQVDPRIDALRASGLLVAEEIEVGGALGGYVISEKLGEGNASISYAAEAQGRRVRLKLLRHEAAWDKRGLQRYLTFTRLWAQVAHHTVPTGIDVGEADKRFYVVHDLVEGETLASRLKRAGPLRFSNVRDILKAIATALGALHERRLAHGNLKPENVLLVTEPGTGERVVLIDAGRDRLRPRAEANGHAIVVGVSSPSSVAPEQIRGQLPSQQSDLYSFGALMFHVLTGKRVFEHERELDMLIAHLNEMPRRPSSVAPAGWVTADIDRVVLGLLEKDPVRRPSSAAAIIEALDGLSSHHRFAMAPTVSEQELTARIDEVLADPNNEEIALALEGLATNENYARRIAEAFMMAASELASEGESEQPKETQKDLYHRAGRLYQDASDLESAEQAYVAILRIDAEDETASAKLEEVRRRLGKYEELIEALVDKAERAEGGPPRARTLSEIGQLYLADLADPEQALVAFTQAFCEDPQSTEYAEQIETLAAAKKQAWGELLATCAEASTQDRSNEDRNTLLSYMGRWYSEHFARPDLALSCFQAILSNDPANEHAIDGLANLYSKAHQWPELAMTLIRRADVTADAAKARDIRCAAADVLEHHLNDLGAARDIYTKVFAQDPAHVTAAKALCRMYERAGDWSGYRDVLDRQTEVQRGEERRRLLCRAAEVSEDRLGDDVDAVKRYSAILAEDPAHVDALRGLDRLYSKQGRFQELLENLRLQLRGSATPRQKIALLERIAGIYDEEFLDPEHAAQALEDVIALDDDHEGALAALSRHYRALSRWDQLATVLDHRARREADPKRRIDLTLARAHVLGDQLAATELAIDAYEKVLQIDPRHEEALESLARLRETAGQEDAALAALEALADKAETKEAKAEHFFRAAKLLETRGDLDRAIDKYKRSFEAAPKQCPSAEALRRVYVKRGHPNAAIDLLEREILSAADDAEKGRLAAEMAVLYEHELKDEANAERSAKRALDYDASNAQALTMLGDAAFSARHFVEAASFYERLVSRAESLARDEAVRLLIRYADALGTSGSAEKAVSATNLLFRLAPDDPVALQRVAAVQFEHGSAKRAAELYANLIERFGEQLGTAERAVATYRLGEAMRRTGDVERAIQMLEQAADLDPSSPLPLEALTHAYEGKTDFKKLVETKNRQLDIAEGDLRVKLLIDIGEIAASKLSDRPLATKSFVAALDERPDDRKLLIRLMQLYSEDKDWSKLIDIVVKLADFVDDQKQRAKYLQTAAVVAAKELQDVDRALDFHAKVLELDRANEKSLDESIELLKQKEDWAAAVELLKEKAKLASAAKEKERMLEAFSELGVLYKDRLGRVGHAIDAYEAAQTVDPNDRTRNELLATLYASNPEKYLDKAVAAQMTMLRNNPFREESYQLLRRLYTDVRRADPAWCLCQALYVLKLAEPDEERFFKHMRSEHPAYAQAVITEDHWHNLLLHPDADAALTSVFALIEPAIIASRTESLGALGYDARYAVDAAQHPYTIGQTLHYVAGVMGMALPPVFENVNDGAGLSFLHAQTPAVVLGAAALEGNIPPQAAAFISARHIAYYRPGLYTRHLLPHPTVLRTWLFAAIRMNAPQFPVAMDIEGPVKDAMSGLEEHLHVQTRDHLARVVSKLLQSGRSLDLKKWVNGVDFTADRAGLVLCHDLETAVEIIRASDETSASIGGQQRLKELVLFAISESYFKLRTELGITIDS